MAGDGFVVLFFIVVGGSAILSWLYLSDDKNTPSSHISEEDQMIAKQNEQHQRSLSIQRNILEEQVRHNRMIEQDMFLNNTKKK